MTSPSPTELKRQIKQLKQSISATRKQINASDEQNVAALLEQNKHASAEVKQLEKALKRLLNRDNSAEASADEIPVSLPTAFEPLTLNLGATLHFSEAELHSKAWRAFVQQHHRSTACHEPELLTAIHDAYQHPVVIVLAHQDEKIVGALPLMILDTPLFGRYGASVPFFNYGGPLTNYRDVAQALVAHSQHLLKKHRLKHILIRTCIPDLPFSCATDKASMVLSLPSNCEALNASLSSKVRSQIKKAGENAFAFRTGQKELLDDFHQILSENMRDLGSPFHGKILFTQLLEQFKDRCTIAVAYLDGKPVSAGLLLANGTTLEIPWASTTKQGNSANANMWFYHQVLSYAVDQKFRHFDFGRSSIEAGTFKFKKQWGAEPVQHYWYTLSATQQAVSAPAAKEFGLLVSCWKLLPVWIARLVGAIIIRGIA